MERYAKNQVNSQNGSTIQGSFAQTTSFSVPALGKETDRQRDHREDAWRQQSQQTSEESQKKDPSVTRSLDQGMIIFRSDAVDGLLWFQRFRVEIVIS